MKTYLKIKIKSLAAEAVLIKFEERKWFKHIGNRDVNKPGEPLKIKFIYQKNHPLRMGLRQHRIDVVRPECRHSNIAYGYMRGRDYKQIENKCYEQPNWARVAEIVRKFSGDKYLPDGARKQLFEDIKSWAAKLPNSNKSVLSSVEATSA